MKRKLKKLLIPIFLSVICGSICGKLVYEIYTTNLTKELTGKKIYLIQAGAYSTYDNMIENTSINNYVYYEDSDGLYKAIIGLTENKSNIEKITKTYKESVIINEYYSKDKELNNKIKEYDQQLSTTTNEEEINKIVLEMLTLYKDTPNKTLTKIST